MRFLLGVFFFSVLLTTGSPLKCEYCVSTTSNCSGEYRLCSRMNTVCMTLKAEIKASVGIPASMKHCTTVDNCKHYESLKGKHISGQLFNITDNLAGLLVGAVIKDVTCTNLRSSSKALVFSASFFPPFLRLLLMKLLF